MTYPNEKPDFSRIQKMDSVWDFMGMKLIHVLESPYEEDGPPRDFVEQMQVSLFAGHCPEERRFYDFLYENLTVRDFLKSDHDAEDLNLDWYSDKFTFPCLDLARNPDIKEYIVKVFWSYGMKHLMVYHLTKGHRIYQVVRIVADFGKDYLLNLPSMVAGVERDKYDDGHEEGDDPLPSFKSVKAVLREDEGLYDWELDHRDEMVEVLIDSGCFTAKELEEISNS